MAGVRIRWRGVARVAAIVVVGLVALRLVPALLQAPEPPPIPANVGLPKARPTVREPAPPVHPEQTKPHRRPVPDAPAATAKIGTRTRHHSHRGSSDPPPKPVEPAPSPTPEYVPPPAPEPAPEAVPTPLPEPPPEPRFVPGDGSQEFAPH
ncbi:MAG: hypothetical protein JST59_16965 [Actinobacteria bacterium]|nr:hypothetical protein [Actinomycetota bacterium]